LKSFLEWRPGLRILVWLAALAALVTTPVLVLRKYGIFNFSIYELRMLLPREGILAGMVCAGTLLVGRLEKRSFGAYGLPVRRALRSSFWEGLLWGFVLLSAVLGMLRLAGVFQVDGLALRGREVWLQAGAWGAYFLAVGVFEELMFRGYLQATLGRAWTFWRAALFLSCLFGLSHLWNRGESPLGILQVVAFALVMCLTLRRTGDLWFAVGAHAAWDWAETFFYGVPNSGLAGTGHWLRTSFHGPAWLTGGATGPEGSLVATLVLVIAFYLLHRRFPAKAAA